MFSKLYYEQGADCSLRVCPKANAWVDYASSDQTAHQPVKNYSDHILSDAALDCTTIFLQSN
jgi:hypothetical protein